MTVRRCVPPSKEGFDILGGDGAEAAARAISEERKDARLLVLFETSLFLRGRCLTVPGSRMLCLPLDGGIYPGKGRRKLKSM